MLRQDSVKPPSKLRQTGFFFDAVFCEIQLKNALRQSSVKTPSNSLTEFIFLIYRYLSTENTPSVSSVKKKSKVE